MSDEIAAALSDRLRDDAALREAVGQAATVEDVIRIMADAGFEVTMEDVTPGEASLELSEGELTNVSGGGFTTYGCNTPTQYFVFTHCYP